MYSVRNEPIATFEYPDCVLLRSFREEWIKCGEAYWYVSVQRYSVSGKYSRSSHDDFGYVSNNLAKVVDGIVVWQNEELSENELCKLKFRLMSLWHKMEIQARAV